MKKYKLGIIGIGMVGSALVRYFESNGRKVFVYDKYNGTGSIEKVNQADIIFICVPTPYDKKKGFDLSAVEEVFKIIKGRKIVVIKSTVLPGTTEKLQKKYPQHKVLVNPEFLREKTADQDIRNPEREIIGYTKKSYSVAKEILKMLPRAPFEKIIPATEAEMVKYFGNTWLATKVIFVNQIYDVCQALKIDYEIVKECAAADKRIGPSHLDIWKAGYRGYGARCFPKDIKALIQFADRKGINLRLHKIVEEINQELMEEQGIKDPEKLKP